MRRWFTVFLTLAYLGTLFLTPASATVKKGAACKKLHQTAISSGSKYTCVKLGKKLVWSKGVKMANPKPTPIRKPTPKPTPIRKPTPTPTPTPPVLLPTGFQDLQARASGISYAAWSKSSQQIASAKSVLGKSTIIIGPNTTLSFSTPLAALDLTSALYSLAKQVNNVYLIYYSQQDIAWAQTNFDSLNDNSVGGSGAAANNCQTTSTCWGASTWLNIAGDGLLLIAVGVQDLNHTSGSLESHEYTHTIQMIQAPHNYASLPRWLLEGGAEWSQSAATYSGDFNKYLEERKRNTNDLFANPSAYTPEWIATFLDLNPGTDWIYWNTYENWRLYDVGLLATEALVALNGPETVMKLYADVGNGQTFMDSFNTEYGMSWVDSVPILAEAISAEIAKGW